MSKFLSPLLLALLLPFYSYSQVNLIATSGAGTGNYSSLKVAFDSINSGYHRGNITLSLTGNTVETATAVLNASGTGSANYSLVRIEPTGGASRTISGSIAGPLIDLNGADNVRINGLNTGGNALIIDNSSTGAAGTSTIRFINDATGDSIQNCTIRGSSTEASLATLLFSTGTATGNDNNVIFNCSIEPSGANLPVNAVFCSGTATSGIENSGNTISGCNIFNYYGATRPTAGILLSTGATGWTLSNNKFYQTATRIYTTANLHRGISIATGDGYIITGNTIGYANSSGTGTTNMVGNSVALTGTFPSSYTTTGTANATKYIAIECSFTAGGAVSSIQNNTIAGFALYSSSSTATLAGNFCAINVNSGNANIGTISGNTIGSVSSNGSIYTVCTVSGGAAVGIYCTSANTINIQNNIIGAIDAMGTTSTVSGGFTGINIAGAGSFTVSDNIIGHTTYPNIRTGNLTTGANLSNAGTTHGAPSGVGKVQGIFNQVSGSALISNNIIRNMLQNSTGTATTSSNVGIISVASGLVTISGNTISNLAGNNLYATVGNGEVSVMGILLRGGAATGSTIIQNTINNLSTVNTGTAGTNVTGISVAANDEIFVTRNLIYNLSNASTSVSATAPGTASGILIRSSSSADVPVNIYNNMIALGNGQLNNTTFIGIWSQNGSTPNPLCRAYHNTVHIEGTVISGAQPSFGFLRSDFSATARTSSMDIRNNIFSNIRTGGTGKHYAISNNYGATTPSATGFGATASNRNMLNADSLTIASWGNTDHTFASWKTNFLCDTSSFSRIPLTFTNPANDLHLSLGSSPTLLESNAQIISGITNDFDGQNRPGPSGSVNGGGIAPDLGADEFDGNPIDISSPIISYINLSNTCNTGNRTLSANIVDITGVPVTLPFKPRVYYKKNAAGTWLSDTGNLASGSVRNGLWNFVINASNMGGLATNDSVYYFVIAQDSSPFNSIGSFPTGVIGTDVNNITSYPQLLSSYLVGGNLSGVYTIDQGQTTGGSNFQNFTALSNALQRGCINGYMEVNVTAASGPYNEQVTIPSINGSSLINRLVINGNNDTLKFTPIAGARHILKLDGSDFVTIRNLNIVGNDLTYGWGIHLTNQAENDSIVNCRIDVSAVTSTTQDNSAGIVVSSSVSDLNAGGNTASRLVVYGDTIIGGYQGIIINGDGITKGNTVVNTSIRDFYSVGVELTQNDSALISGNNISRANRVTVTTFEGITLGAGNKRARILANRIHDTHNAATLQTGASYGIYAASCDAAPGEENKVFNNILYNFNSGSGTQYAIYNVGSDGFIYYHNSIALGHLLSTAGLTRGFFQTTAASNIVFRNNIISISRSGTGDKHCIYFGTTTSSIVSNNNVFFLNITGSGSEGIGYFGADFVTLANWKTANSNAYDQASVSVNPLYLSPSTGDLTPSAFSINNTAPNLGVTTDINGITRGANPDPGAFEFTPPAIDAKIEWVSPVSPSSAGNNIITIRIVNTIAATTITSVEVEYTDGTTPVSQTFSGLTISGITSQNLSFSTPFNLAVPASLRAYIKSVNGITDGNQLNDTTTLQNICVGISGGVYTINSAQVTGGGNFQSFTDAINAISSCGIAGPVTLNVDPASGPYTEQITIPQIPGSSASNRLTINGNGRTIQFTPTTAARHIIRLNGADFVSLKNLNIVGLATDFDWGIHLTNGAENDSIVNCNINLSANTSTTQSNSACIVASGSTTVVTTTGNTARNLVITGCTLSGAYQGIIIQGNVVNTKYNRILNNNVQDFYAIGIEVGQNDSSLVEHNNISRANRITVGTFEGITISGATQNTRIHANQIHDTHNSATTQSGTAYGIYSPTSDAPIGAENIVSNNIIYNFNSITGTQYGIYNTGSDGMYYYHNTVVLANQTSTSGITRGFYQTTAAANLIIRNNIFYITRTGSGAKNCLYFNTTTSTITSNNNVLYLNSPAGTNGIGFYSANQVTLANWKTANGGIYDQQSIDADPLFNSSSNFRIVPNSPAIGMGSPSVVTTDFLGVSRNLTTPTAGAYEQGADFIPPSFTFSPISNTGSTSNRTLNNYLTVIDVSLVDSNTNRPKLYYKRTTDNNVYAGNTNLDNGWKWVEATNNSNPYSFIINYSILNGGGVNIGDTIQYFMVVQDLSTNKNVGISNGLSFSSVPDSVDLQPSAFPIGGTIPFYKIIPSVNGNYTVGTGGSPGLVTLTDVSNFLRQNVINGNVLFELLPTYNSSTEVFPIIFDEVGTMGGNWNVTIRPSASATGLETSGYPLTAGIIVLNGTDRITFDGRAGGTGINKDWTIRNKQSAGALTPTITLQNDAISNTFEYLNIEGGNNVTTSGVILLSTTNQSKGNDSNMFVNNVIRDRSDSIGIPVNAIYSTGSVNATNSNIQISTNNIFNFLTNGVAVTAGGNGNNWNISNNNFYYNNITVSANAQTAINFIPGLGSSNNNINGNYIGGSLPGASGTTWNNSGANLFAGIIVACDTVSLTTINGNTIANITKTSTGASSFTGIRNTNGWVSINNNIIGDTLVSNSIVNNGTSTITGIEADNTYATPVTDVLNNKIANISANNAAAGARVRGIDYSSGGTNSPAVRINNNRIFNLSTASAGTGFAAGNVTVMGIYTFPGTNYSAPSEIKNNTIYNISATNSGAIATTAAGLTLTNLKGIVSGNIIYDIKNASTGTGATRGVAAGMFVRFLLDGIITNNMIHIGPGNSDSTQINGIMIAGTNGNLHYYLNNSVYISNPTGNSVSSYAFHRGENNVATASAHPVILRNNIFYNTVSSSGLHHAIGIEDTANLAGNFSSNWNLFYTVNPNTTGQVVATSNTLSNWKITVANDSASKSKVVNFIAPATANLRLAGGSVGDFDLAGIPVAQVTNDIDGDTRHPNFPYMGADELPGSPLPVELGSLQAIAKGNDAHLIWNTVSELHLSHFEVEFSTDNIHFSKLGQTRAYGHSSANVGYSFQHKNAFETGNILYYRLKSVDINTRFEYSQTVRVQFNGSSALANLVIYPNPFTNQIHITLPVTAITPVSAEIFDINGKLQMEGKYLPTSNGIDIHTDQLNSGIYFIRISINSQTITKKLVK